MLRYKDMTRKFLNLALRAASHSGSTLLVNNTIDILSKQVEEEINGCTGNVEPVTVPMNVAPPSDLVSTTCLKKKEVQTKTSKRKKTFLDKKRKFTKGNKKKGQGSMVCSSCKIYLILFIVFGRKNLTVPIVFFHFCWQEQENIKVASDDGARVQNISPGTSLPKEGMSEAYMTINTFSQLLTVFAQTSLLLLFSSDLSTDDTLLFCFLIFSRDH
jgi:hypothetical protein